jgi:hypothetical protein
MAVPIYHHASWDRALFFRSRPCNPRNGHRCGRADKEEIFGTDGLLEPPSPGLAVAFPHPDRAVTDPAVYWITDNEASFVPPPQYLTPWAPRLEWVASVWGAETAWAVTSLSPAVPALLMKYRA